MLRQWNIIKKMLDGNQYMFCHNKIPGPYFPWNKMFCTLTFLPNILFNFQSIYGKNGMQKKNFIWIEGKHKFVSKRNSNISSILFLFTDKDWNFNEILLAAVEVVSLQFHWNITGSVLIFSPIDE